MKRFFTSLAFLSRIPVPFSWQTQDTKAFKRLPRDFWLAGLVLGALLALISLGLTSVLPVALSMAMLAGIQIIVGGAFHEDGLADLADSMGAFDRKRKLEIMKDSRLGTFGVSALATLFLVRFSGYSFFAERAHFDIAIFLLLVGVWSRWGCVFVSQILPSAHTEGKGIAKGFDKPGWPNLTGSLAVLIILSFSIGPVWLIGLLSAQLIMIPTCVLYFKKTFQGVTGDCLGASCILIEMTSIATTVASTNLFSQ